MISSRSTGVRECRRRFPTERLVLLWLGSSVGNSSQEEAVQFFRDVMAAAGQNSQARLWKLSPEGRDGSCDAPTTGRQWPLAEQ